MEGLVCEGEGFVCVREGLEGGVGACVRGLVCKLEGFPYVRGDWCVSYFDGLTLAPHDHMQSQITNLSHSHLWKCTHHAVHESCNTCSPFML